MISRSLLAAAVVALSFGGANAATYYADQGLQSNDKTVAKNRSDMNTAFDGDASTFYSLGIGGTLTIDTSPNRIASVSVLEITNSAPNTSYPESAEIWLGGSIIDGAWDSDGAVRFGEIFNQDPNNRELTFNSDYGTIMMTGQGGRETGWELTLNSDAIYSLITLVDTTWLNYADAYELLASDGFDVGEFRVAAIPLPASVLMFMGALGGLGFVSRRREADT